MKPIASSAKSWFLNYVSCPDVNLRLVIHNDGELGYEVEHLRRARYVLARRGCDISSVIEVPEWRGPFTMLRCIWEYAVELKGNDDEPASGADGSSSCVRMSSPREQQLLDRITRMSEVVGWTVCDVFGDKTRNEVVLSGQSGIDW
jgi:hypothetical protein